MKEEEELEVGGGGGGGRAKRRVENEDKTNGRPSWEGIVIFKKKEKGVSFDAKITHDNFLKWGRIKIH